ncbi:MAG: hypothetical protein QOC97_1173 [Chloroflexota bacterium]|nr:hypothetical protein [Chloroflexota bacterium]
MDPESAADHEAHEASPPLRPDHRTWVIVALIGVALVVAGVLVVRSQSSVDQATAIEIASDFALKSQPAGTQIRGIHETAVSEVGNAWRIEISFDALAAGDASANPEPRHLLIDVDKGSGTPTIVGQG